MTKVISFVNPVFSRFSYNYGNFATIFMDNAVTVPVNRWKIRRFLLDWI